MLCENSDSISPSKDDKRVLVLVEDTNLMQAFTKSGVTSAPTSISAQVAFCFGSIMKHFFIHLGRQDVRQFQLRIQAPPFLVLKVDVELGEGGQLAVVAFPNLGRARGECASNKCLAIWSKDDLIHIFAC